MSKVKVDKKALKQAAIERKEKAIENAELELAKAKENVSNAKKEDKKAAKAAFKDAKANLKKVKKSNIKEYMYVEEKEEAPQVVETPVEEVSPVEEAPAPIEDEVAEEAPVEEAVVEEAAIEENEKVVEDVQVEETPVEEEVIEEAPIEEAVVEEAEEVAVEDVEEEVVEEAPVEEVVEEAPAPKKPAAPKTNANGKKLSPRKQGVVSVVVPTKEEKKAKEKAEKKAAAPKKAPAAPKKAERITVISGDAKDTFGKYYIIANDSNPNRPYKFQLKANNGQLLFESEPYKVKPKLASITAFKKHCANGTFEVDEDKAGNFRYKLYSKTDMLIGVGESYLSKSACENSIESVKNFAESATVIEDTTIEE